MFVQSTPESILKREIENVMKTNGMRVRVVEKGGRQVSNIVQRSDVEPVKDCGKECAICKSSPSGQCWKEGVCYSVTCTVCEKGGIQAKMFGETGRSARIRCSEHYKALEEKKKKSNLWEHVQKFHNGVVTDEMFKFSVLSVHGTDPLSRQLKEALNIEKGGLTDHFMNDKQEWIRPAGLQFTVERM